MPGKFIGILIPAKFFNVVFISYKTAEMQASSGLQPSALFGQKSI